KENTDNNTDSVAKHLDSLQAHNDRINDLVDTVVIHKNKINSIYDSLGNIYTDDQVDALLLAKQNVSDTSIKDATRYWVGQNYQTTLTNPITTPNVGVNTYIPHYSGTTTIDTSGAYFDGKNVTFPGSINASSYISSQSAGSSTDPDLNTGIGTHFAITVSPSANDASGIGKGAAIGGKYPTWFQTGNVNGWGWKWYTGITEIASLGRAGNFSISSTLKVGSIPNSLSDTILVDSAWNVKKRIVSRGILSIDTMKIVRTDQIDTLTQKLYLTGISKQDTATRVLGYNVGTGEVKAMRYIHGVASADSMVSGGNNYITIGGTQYLYYKINTSGASPGTMAVRDTVGVLIQGDSCKILTAGHYKIRVWVAATTSNANDKIRVKLFTNNVANPTALGRFLINSMGTGNQSTENYMWYKEFSVNDWISFHVTNITGSRAVYISDMKFFIERVYE
ncbi:MAG: hypothetical protein PHS93_10290, partial [Candidatus Omnitrophica bacterium]|nr:hypothetical protein [Candidatus Omnitrophota bacterium]